MRQELSLFRSVILFLRNNYRSTRGFLWSTYSSRWKLDRSDSCTGCFAKSQCPYLCSYCNMFGNRCTPRKPSKSLRHLPPCVSRSISAKSPFQKASRMTLGTIRWRSCCLLGRPVHHTRGCNRTRRTVGKIRPEMELFPLRPISHKHMEFLGRILRWLHWKQTSNVGFQRSHAHLPVDIDQEN